MPDSYTVKIQCDQTGAKVLIYDVPHQDFIHEASTSDAKRIIDNYGLEPLTKVYAEATVDENGLLHLGRKIEEHEVTE